jgi:hypothetical protein
MNANQNATNLAGGPPARSNDEIADDNVQAVLAAKR